MNADGHLCQPSVHLERAMIAAAGNFKITVKRGKTWKKAFLGTDFRAERFTTDTGSTLLSSQNLSLTKPKDERYDGGAK